MRIVSVLFVLVTVFLGSIASDGAGALERPVDAAKFQTSAPFAFMVDYDTGTVLFDKNADQSMAPASTSKLLTAEIVFNELAQGRLKLDDTMTISPNAWHRGGVGSGGSTMFAKVNSNVRVEDLLRGLIIDSGNDAAIALAEGIAGSESSFADMMNKRAHELGMTHSSFTNPWGENDPHEQVTARDMARLTAYIIKTYPEYYKYFGEKEFTWNKIRQFNRNPLLKMDIGADGVKTGDIKESGFGLVGSAVQNGHRLILVINGLKTARERAEESRKLLEWGFRAFDSKLMFTAGEVIGWAKVFGGAQGSVPLVANGDVRLLVPRGTDMRLTTKIVYHGPLLAPVAKGVQVAKLKVWHENTQLIDVPLKTDADVTVGSLPQRALDAGLELATSLFMKSFAKN